MAHTAFTAVALKEYVDTFGESSNIVSMIHLDMDNHTGMLPIDTTNNMELSLG